jgi:HK97 family phage major capsid protein
VGTLKVEPAVSIGRRAAPFGAPQCRSRRLLQLCAGRTAAVAALWCWSRWWLHAAPAHAGTGVLVAAIVVAGRAREIREQREKLIKDAGDLMGANNTFENDDKRSQFDAHMADISVLRVALEDVERSEKIAAMTRQTLPESQRQETGSRSEDVAAADRAIPSFLRGGFNALGAESRTALSRVNLPVDGESRDMSTVSAPDGGILVAPDTRFMSKILQAMKYFGGMEAAGAEVFNTNTAGPLPIPMGDDTGNVGAIVGEAAASAHAGGTSPTLTALVLNGYLYSSKVIKVSWQMLRDPAIDVEGYVGGLLGERLARIQNTHFTTGIGGGQPYGLTVQATVGRQSATGFSTSLAFDDIFRTIHSVDVAYRNEKCKWQFADTTALALRLAKDGNGRYLWPEMGNTQVGQPGVLGGYGFVINNDMPAMAASAKYASFGDHSYYKIRRIGGITLARVDQLYIESGQVGFLAFQSADGGLADPGQHPVKLLQNSAT